MGKVRKSPALAWLSLSSSALILASAAAASPWSLSVSAAAGHVSELLHHPNPRAGLELDVVRDVNKVAGVGLECGWWEEIGSQGFASIDPAYPEQEHQREIAVAALIRASARFGDSRPFLLAGVGEYLTMHRLRYYGGGSDHRLDHAPGLSVGA